MTKGFHKKTSKRVPLKRRYKIEKRVKQHNKKLKKQARKQKQDKKAYREAKKVEKEQVVLTKQADKSKKMKGTNQTQPNKTEV